MTQIPRLIAVAVACFVPFGAACAPDGSLGDTSSDPGEVRKAALNAPLTLVEIMTHAYDAGLPCEALVTAGAVAMGESGGYADIVSGPNFDGSYDYGLWQINDIHAGSFDFARILEPGYNASAMASLGNQGTTWQPWVAYTNGSYAQFLDQAEAAYASLVFCGGDGGGSDDGACASLGYQGACLGDLSIWFDAAQGCRIRSCASEGRTCGFFDDTPDEGYGCQGGTSGASTIACASLGYEGACYGDVVVWEDAPGACRYVDCATRGERCADAGTIGFDCVP